MDISPYVGDALRQMRQRVGLSQEDFALRAGLDRTYVSGIERGVRNPTVASLQKLAEALGVTLDRIFIEARKQAEEASRTR